jgi:hypothetical protein
MPTNRIYRRRGAPAYCRYCRVPLCHHEKTFCSRACQLAWKEAQPEGEHSCAVCGGRFSGKPWRKRCDACVRADGAV